MEPNLLFLTSLSSVLSIGLMGPLKESAKAEGFPRSCRANRVGYDAVVMSTRLTSAAVGHFTLAEETALAPRCVDSSFSSSALPVRV